MVFIIYAALFRLAVILAGVACVVMGYRLFVLGVMPRDGSEVDAQAGEIRLSLRNAAPGTCFAGFGVFLIVAMLVQGNPELRLSETISDIGAVREVSYRGNDDGVAAFLRRGKSLEDANRHDEAIRAYAQALADRDRPLGEAAAPLKAIAAIYKKQGRYDEALAYARLANQIEPGDAAGVALLARIQWDRGERERAVKLMVHASTIDPALRSELDRMQAK